MSTERTELEMELRLLRKDDLIAFIMSGELGMMPRAVDTIREWRLRHEWEHRRADAAAHSEGWLSEGLDGAARRAYDAAWDREQRAYNKLQAFWDERDRRRALSVPRSPLTPPPDREGQG